MCYDAVREIRRANSKVQIIVLVSRACLSDAITSIQESVSAFFIKPVDSEELKLAIEKAMKKGKAEREKEQLLESLHRHLSQNKG
jgi:DNA-binding NtrC family response regulator